MVEYRFYKYKMLMYGIEAGEMTMAEGQMMLWKIKIRRECEAQHRYSIKEGQLRSRSEGRISQGR